MSLVKVFSGIYAFNGWESTTPSGNGSTLEETVHTRRELIKLIKEYEIKTLYDAPCGDFNWMPHVLRQVSVNYHGVDIVPQAILNNSRTHGNGGKIRFSVGDITVDPPPKADLWLCRDCLQHLSLENAAKALILFLRSEVTYLLTTIGITPLSENVDIPNGHYRPLDPTKPPFNFPLPIARIEDWNRKDSERWLGLWRREDVVRHFEKAPEADLRRSWEHED